MGATSKIEWTEATWNPVTGCTKVSPGCDNCYAEKIVERFHGKGSFAIVKRSDEKLFLPFSWRRPRRVFVNSMSDLFHADVPDSFIAHVWSVMARTPQHTYQVLTKRHARMRSLLSKPSFRDNTLSLAKTDTWPLPNVWLGVSVENQHWAEIRIPELQRTPAAVRWLSCEPLLGPVDLTPCAEFPDVDWVVAGGESGPGARPMHPEWARAIRDACVVAGVPFFFKQWGNWVPQPLYSTDDRHHVVMLDGRDRGTPWRGWKVDQPDAVVMERVGKKLAGRELDGRVHDEYPAVA